MIPIKKLVDDKLSIEFLDSITELLSSNQLTTIKNKIDAISVKRPNDNPITLLFNFYVDKGDFDPQEAIKDSNGYDVSFQNGLDAEGKPNITAIYPIPIFISNNVGGDYQRSAELDAYSAGYTYEIIASDEDYEDIQKILSFHTDRLNQFIDSNTFAVIEDTDESYTCTESFTLPVFEEVMNYQGRKIIVAGIGVSMLFIKNGRLGNSINLYFKINSNIQTVNATALIVGKPYKIKTLGNTNWNTVAGTTGVTYSVGSEFICAVVGTGTGVAETNDFYKIPFLSFAVKKSKVGNSHTFQGERIMKNLHNQQMVGFSTRLIYTKSEITRSFLNEIFDDAFLTKKYTMKYHDGKIGANGLPIISSDSITKEYIVMVSDGAMNGDIGDFITIELSFVIAKEL
jgi:hypothetical protein